MPPLAFFRLFLLALYTQPGIFTNLSKNLSLVSIKNNPSISGSSKIFTDISCFFTLGALGLAVPRATPFPLYYRFTINRIQL